MCVPGITALRRRCAVTDRGQAQEQEQEHEHEHTSKSGDAQAASPLGNVDQLPRDDREPRIHAVAAVLVVCMRIEARVGAAHAVQVPRARPCLA